MESPCSRCGCQRPFHDRWEQQSKINYLFRQDAKKIAASNASILADRDLTILELQEGQKWLQQKVKKQAAHLRRLEEKLRKLGKEPYEREETKS